MSGLRPPDDRCPRAIDAGPYVLHALADDEAGAFAAHLEQCSACRDEVAALQVPADALPLSVVQIGPPPELKDRIMAVVESEAALLRAAGPEADRAPRTHPRERRRLGWGAFSLRPGVAAGLACALLALGVGGGLLASGGSDTPRTRVYSANVTAPGATASLTVTGSRAALRLRGMPSPPRGRVYQVWFQRDGRAPVPTHTLFNVRSDGRATVEIEEPVDGVDRVMVTAEPSGGSRAPTSAPVITASPA